MYSISPRYQSTCRKGIPRIVIKPTTEPVSLGDMRDQLNLGSSTAFDSFLTFAIKVARKQLENRLDRSFMDQRWRMYFDRFPYGSASGGSPSPFGLRGYPIRLRKGPVRTINQIAYRDTSGATITLDPANYVLDPYRDNGRGNVLLAYGQSAWPSSRINDWNSMYVEMDCGGTLVGDVPEEILMGIRLIVTEFFERRSVMSLAGLGKRVLEDLDAITGPYNMTPRVGAF